MKKLIELPDNIKKILDDYKEKTGIPVTQYIQKAVYKQMIRDDLIQIKTRIVYIEENEVEVEPAEGEIFCDGDSCEVTPQ